MLKTALRLNSKAFAVSFGDFLNQENQKRKTTTAS
jgi:hypothetical protein